RGPHARRKLWQLFPVAGGQVDEEGVSKGWKIAKSHMRAMLESARGINPVDESDTAKAKRSVASFSEFDGLEFVARIGIEKGAPASGGAKYPDKNQIAHVVTPDEPEWQRVTNGEEVPPKMPGNSEPTVLKVAVPAQPAWKSPSPAATQALPPWVHG